MLNHLCDSMIRRLDNHVRKLFKFILTSPTGVPYAYQNKGRPVLRSLSVYLPCISLPACSCCVHIHAGTCTVGTFPRSSCQSGHNYYCSAYMQQIHFILGCDSSSLRFVFHTLFIITVTVMLLDCQQNINN